MKRKFTFLMAALFTLAFLMPPQWVIGQNTYELVTNVNQLSDGDEIIIASIKEAGSGYAIGAANGPNNRKAVAVTASNSNTKIIITTAIDNENETVANANTAINTLTKPLEITLVTSNSNWNLKEVLSDGNMYLNGGSKKKSGNNNVLKADASVETGTGQNVANGVWSISVNTTSYVASISNQNNFSIKLNGTIFASYSSGQTDVYIYKKQASGGGSTPSITISGEGINNNTITLNHNDITNHSATVTPANLGDNPTLNIKRFSDSGCTTEYTGTDFTASLTGTTITYGFANANTSQTTPRTYYMRVNCGETNSNVITVTQGAAPYTVSFNLDGGIFVANDNFTSNPSSIAAGTYALPSATKTNWNFGGWKLDGTETVYTAGASYTVSGNVSFTAQWTKSLSATYTVATATSVTPSGSVPSGSSATFSNTYTSNKEQMTGGNYMTLTLSGYAGQRIVGIVLKMKSNGSSGAGYMSAIAGTTTLASVGSSESPVTFNNWPGMTGYTTSYTNVTIPLSNDVYSIQNNENIVVTIHATTNSLFCQSFTIIYQDASLPGLGVHDITLDYDATSGEISYQLVSPNGSTLEASTTDTWITNLAVNTSDSKVTFSTSANLGAIRQGTITLTYGDIVKNVKVTQNAQIFTVTYNANGGTGTMASAEYSYGSTVTVLANAFTNGDLLFANWNTVDGGTGTAYNPGESFNITSNVTLYAQWRTNNNYSLVNSVTDLIPGKHYIIVGKYTDGQSADHYYAMGAQSSNIRSAVPVTMTGSAINEVTGVREFVLSGDTTNKWTLYDKLQPGYLYATSTSNNNIGTRTNNDDANSQYAISFFDNDEAKIVAQGTNTRNTIKFNYNNGSPRFSSYVESTTQNLSNYAYIYVKNDDEDYEFYSATNFNSGLSIADGETYTVKNGGLLNVVTTITGSTSSNLIIEDGGQMKSNNPIIATIKKNITGYGEGNQQNAANYYLIASPIAAEVNSTLVPVDSNDEYLFNDMDLYWFDGTSIQQWYNPKSENNDGSISAQVTLIPTKGYLYARKNDGVISLSADNITQFPATNANISSPENMNNTASYTFGKYNLVGNPYTCNAYLVGVSDFLRMNATGDAIVLASDNVIKPMEGVFVIFADDDYDSNKVTFTTTAPDANAAPGAVNMMLSQKQNERGNASTIDAARVRFGQSNNLPKVNLLGNGTSLYIPQGGKDYAVVNAESNGELPVNFKAAENGTYTIDFSMDNVEFNYLHLIDNMTGIDVDLLATPSYTFEARKNDYASRFRLVFNANSIDENDNENENSNFAFINNGNIVIMNAGEATLQIVDMLGRVVNTVNVNGNATVSMNTNGVYVLRLINGESVKTQKIVVK